MQKTRRGQGRRHLSQEPGSRSWYPLGIVRHLETVRLAQQKVLRSLLLRTAP